MLLLFMSSLFNVAWNILASAHGVIGHLKVRQEYSDYLSILSPAFALKPQWNPNFPSKNSTILCTKTQFKTGRSDKFQTRFYYASTKCENILTVSNTVGM